MKRKRGLLTRATVFLLVFALIFGTMPTNANVVAAETGYDIYIAEKETAVDIESSGDYSNEKDEMYFDEDTYYGEDEILDYVHEGYIAIMPFGNHVQVWTAEQFYDAMREFHLENIQSLTIELMADIEDAISQIGVSSGRELTLTGNYNFRLSRDGSSIVHVSSDGIFTLDGPNLISEGGAGWGGNRGATLWDGTFIMISGSISGNNGSGVEVWRDGTFIMQGGEIHNNRPSINRANEFGGGVYVRNGGTFIMQGGEIHNNTAVSGGGMYVSSGGTFVMEGGEIHNNRTTRSGGGVYVAVGGTLTMDGQAIIRDNLVTAPPNLGGSGGGGVHSRGDFTLTGNAEVYNNRVTGGLHGHGGGIRLSNGSFVMTGGKISENWASANGGGIFAQAAVTTFTLDGGVIENNIANGWYGVDGDAGVMTHIHRDGGGGGIYTFSHLTIYNAMIRNNEAARASGGGVQARAGLTIYSGEIRNNTAVGLRGGDGGGILVLGDTTLGSPDAIGEVIIYGNDARFGGGIAASFPPVGFGNLIIHDNVKIFGNVASYGVGGVSADNLIMHGGLITENRSLTYDRGGVSAVTFTMHDGFIVENFGRGVSAGTFTMRGGLIAENITSEDGGGVFATNFTMHDGKITENEAKRGGGVAINSRFTMHGGEIVGNTAEYVGGGVLVTLGFTGNSNAHIHGGKIGENISGGNGGGVYLGYYHDGTFNPRWSHLRMYGGEISGNIADGDGGGIWAGDVGTIHLFYGHIRNNNAGNDGGGVFTTSHPPDYRVPMVSPDYIRIMAIGSGMYFSGNTARAAYRPHPSAVEIFRIQFGSTSIFNHVLNNYDINFVGDPNFVPVTARVTFDLNGGDVDGDTENIIREIIEGTNVGVTNVPEPLRTGYNFDGWRHAGMAIDAANKTSVQVAAHFVTDDITFTAQWTLAVTEHIITFNLNGGHVVGVTTDIYVRAVEGEAVGITNIPELYKDAHIFDGWRYADMATDASNKTSEQVAAHIVTDDITFIAQWILREYTVTFDFNGGTIGGVITYTTVQIIYGRGIGLGNVPAMMREGYEFDGWRHAGMADDAANKYSSEVALFVVTGDITFTVQWTRVGNGVEPTEYTVTFELHGGTGYAPQQTVRYNETASRPAVNPTRTGYNFAGWFTLATGGEEFNFAVGITENTTVHAQWTPVGNGGGTGPGSGTGGGTGGGGVVTPPTDDSNVVIVGNPNAPGQVGNAIESVLDSNDDVDQVILVIPDDATSVSIPDDSKRLLIDAEADLVIVQGDVTITIPTDVIRELEEHDSPRINLNIEVTDVEDGFIAIEIDFTAPGNREVSNQFDNSITVTVDMGDVEVTNPYRITAIDEDGNRIGGRFDPETGLFEFGTNTTGLFVIEYVEDLNRVTMSIGSYVITNLAQNVYDIMDVAPVIQESRTLVPIRFISYALGAEVSWDEETREVTIKIGERELTFAIGEMAPGMDVPAQIMNNRTMVPIRFVGEFFGATVIWDESEGLVEVIL